MTPYEFYRARIQAQIDVRRAYYQERGYRFRERDVAHHTESDLSEAILAVDTTEDARRFFAGLVIDNAIRDEAVDPATRARHQIGHCFEEGMSPERRAMWLSVIGCGVTAAYDIALQEVR